MNEIYKLNPLKKGKLGLAKRVFLSAIVLFGIHTNHVYSQTTYTFTSAGVQGRVGPTQGQLNTAYLSTNLNGSVTSTSGIQEFTVPVTGLYSIDASGAAGGNSINTYKLGGLGAQIKGEFNLTAGQVLNIIVGQTAASSYVGSNQYQAGGGGGGSFVWLSTSTVPLVVAGGGGGGGALQGTSFDGVGGTITNAGTASSGSFVSVGGTLGSGGGENSGNGEHAHGGSAGGGWLTDGASVISAGTGGSNILYNGGLGGYNGSFGGQNYGSDGGFGGGGGGVIGGGGGGGYSGGGAGSQPNSSGWFENGGGGGGSFNSGTNQVNTGSVVAGNGVVLLTQLCAPGATPTSTTPASNQAICENNTTTLSVVGTGTLNWYSSPSSTLSLASGSVYVTSTLAAGSYTFYAASTNTCAEGARTPITVTVNASPTIAISGGTAVACGGVPVNLTASGADTYSWSTGDLTASTAPSPNVNSTYTVTGTSTVTGCSGNAIISVSVIPAPSLLVTGTATFCMGSSTSTVLTVSGADTYTWSTSSNSTSIAVTPTATTIYTVSGTSTVTGCTNSITASVVVSNCTSLNSISSGAITGLSIYPNPHNGLFTVELNSTSQIIVMNILGEQIINETFRSGNHKLDILNQPNGIYFVKIIKEGNQQTVKLIKE